MKYSEKTEKQVLLTSNRVCAICAWFNNDWIPKKQVQIAHIDRNKTNNDPSNLVVLCLNHHDQYDSLPSQSKRMTPNELRNWKQKVEKKVAQEVIAPDLEGIQSLFTVHELQDIKLMDQKIIQAFERYRKRVEKSKKGAIRILLVGRTGVGKSSTINNLIGRDIAPVGDFEPETASIEVYRTNISDFKYEIFDTPGLCDDLPYKSKDKSRIKDIKEKVNFVDLLLYVTSLLDHRVTGDEKRGIQIVTKGLGKKIWKHALVVFTHSADVSKKDFPRSRKERTRLLLEQIRINAPHADMSEEHCVCIDNKKDIKGDDVGISELWLQSFLRIEKRGVLQFMISQMPRVRKKPSEVREDINEIRTQEFTKEIKRTLPPQLDTYISTDRNSMKKKEISGLNTKKTQEPIKKIEEPQPIQLIAYEPVLENKTEQVRPEISSDMYEFPTSSIIELNERQIRKFRSHAKENLKDVLTVAVGVTLGASIGSLASPVGTLVGGVIGGAVTAIVKLFRRRA